MTVNRQTWTFPLFCGRKITSSNNSFNEAVTSLYNYDQAIKNGGCDNSLRLVCVHKQNLLLKHRKDPLQTNIQTKAKRRGVESVNSTIFDFNGESSGCGGHIRYFFPRGLCNSSSEMFPVPCDFTLSLISPAVSLFKQFFWEVTNN